ncbi:hypothetical protein ACFP3I_24705 [Chryseobacterium arachidis]|uniref:hypothetical protein n=1 Tax=Chryseobacterium arachidis TaxID=1416778 RepID=UPI003616414C
MHQLYKVFRLQRIVSSSGGKSCPEIKETTLPILHHSQLSGISNGIPHQYI